MAQLMIVSSQASLSIYKMEHTPSLRPGSDKVHVVSSALQEQIESFEVEVLGHGDGI